MVSSGNREIQSGNAFEREPLIATSLDLVSPPPPQPKGSSSTTATKICFSIATLLLHLKNKFTITNYVDVLYKLRFVTIFVWVLAGGVSAAFFMQFISDCSQEFEAPEGTPAYDASKKMHTYFPSFIDTMDLAVFIESFAPEKVLLTDMNQSTTRCVSEFLSEVGRRLSEKTNSSSRKNSFADDLESFQSYYSLKSIGVDSLAARLMDRKTQRRTIAPVRLWGQFASKAGMNRALEAEAFIRNVADGFEAEATPNVNNNYNDNNNHGDDGTPNDNDNIIYTRKKVTKRLDSDCLATLQIVGVPLLVNEALEASAADMGKSDGIVLPIALLVMAVTVKSLRLMVLPMLTVGLSLAVSFAIMCGVTRIMTVSSAAPSLMMSLGICMSIDYCLFIVSRYVQEVRIHMKAIRNAASACNSVSASASPLSLLQQQQPADHQEQKEQQQQQPDQHDDVVHDLEASKLIIARVIGGAGHTIVVSGSTLILSLIALVFFPLNILQSFGWGCSLTVFTSLCVSLTLCPTLLLTFPKFFENGAKNLQYPSWVPKFLVEKVFNHKEDDGVISFDLSAAKAEGKDHHYDHHHDNGVVVGHHHGQANATEQQSNLLEAQDQPSPSLVVITAGEETLLGSQKKSNANEDKDTINENVEDKDKEIEENAAIKVPNRYSALIANDEESSSSAVARAVNSASATIDTTGKSNTTKKRKQQQPCTQGSADHTARVDTKTHKDTDEDDNSYENGDIAMYASIINGTIFRHLHRTMIWPYNLVAFLFTVAMAGGMGVAILLEFRITDSFELALPRGYTITESYLRLVQVFGFSYMYPYQMLLEFKPPHQPTLKQNGGYHYDRDDDGYGGDYYFSSTTTEDLAKSPRGILEPFMFNFSKAAMRFVTADTDLPGGLGVGDLSGVLAFGGRWITSTEVDDCLRWFNTSNSDHNALSSVSVGGGGRELEETLVDFDVENNNNNNNNNKRRFTNNTDGNTTCTMELLTLLAGTVTRNRDAMLMMLFINTDPIGNEGDAFYRRLLKLADAFLDWARGGCILDPQSPYFASQMAAAKVLAESHSDSGEDDEDKDRSDEKKIDAASGTPILSLSRVVVANSAEPTPTIPPSVAKKAKLVSNQVKFYFSGIGPQSMDAVATVYRLFPIVIAVSGAVVLLVVGLSFKSVLIPLRCVLSIALTELFVFGWVALVYSLEPHGIFDWMNVPAITSYHAVTWIDPIVAFSVVLGIALDYDVFLLTRVFELRMDEREVEDSDAKNRLLKPTEREHEEENKNDLPSCASVENARSDQLIVVEGNIVTKKEQQTRPKKSCLSTHDAILVGVCDTGPIITSAGIIMSIAFFGMLLSAMPLLNVLGMFLVTAVLFDTFIIRTLLGPSALSLLGELSWWPRKPPIVQNRF